MVSPSPLAAILSFTRRRLLVTDEVSHTDSDFYAGYYIVNILCVVFGIVTFFGFIKPLSLIHI